MRVVVVNHISLDGVLQGPGRPDEDPRGGFRHGGWALPDDDPAMAAAMGARLGRDFSWLFGRITYEDLLGHWNAVGGPFRDGLNGVTKYVVSSSAATGLPWPNSVLISGDVPAELASLRDRPGGNLVIMGSSRLVQSLLPLDLVDELFLMIHPVVLGSGIRLFGDEADTHRFDLTSPERTRGGVVMACYERRSP